MNSWLIAEINHTGSDKNRNSLREQPKLSASRPN